MDCLVFEQQARRYAWNQRCKELMEYKQKHRDCNVPKSDGLNKPLANWVGNLIERNVPSDLYI
jgi:hypothetical protein